MGYEAEMILAVTLILTTQSPMQAVAQDYLDALFQYAPSQAAVAGYHQHNVDQHLDDLSPAARQKRLAWLRAFSDRLEALPTAQLDREDEADRDLLRQQIKLERLDLEEAHDYTKRCDLPLDTLGNIFFTMVAREYAPLDKRAADVVARLSEVPRYLAQARAQLTANVPEFRAAAKDDGEGVLEYFDQLPPAFARSSSAAQLAKMLPPARQAVQDYLAFVDGELARRPATSFRYGKRLYDLRFGPFLQTDRTPADVLATARRRMGEVKTEMARLAQAINGKPDIRAALDQVATDHPPAAQLFTTVRDDLKQATAFVRDKKLVTLAAHDNLKVVETPPFLRSQYGVAAFDGAPPLQPELEGFYYVTPFPSDWPAAKVESKLREYNRWMLYILTIHEAMPGHYVQLEAANRVQPEWRRALRWVTGAGAYIEGWAQYTQELMVAAGFAGKDPRLALTNAKMELRALANTILDIELQSGQLSDEQAMKLMTEEAFQERSEAELKLRRAKLSVTQLCSYFVGLEAWRALRRDAEARPGFDLRAFHDRALGEGAVTLPTLKKLLAK
jgi:uncharacterized protein (DUF885 family)